jgi:hypothetical protein
MKPDAPPSFTCPFCGALSHNPNDARERYCGRCHRFVDDASWVEAEVELFAAEVGTCLAIIGGQRKPDPAFYQAGWDAHAAGKQFHEGPRPFHCVEALCWRMGWNDRALMRLADDPPGEPEDG